LLIAANKGQTEMVKALLDQGADIFAKTRQGRSALHLAALSNNVDTLAVNG
jgi:ankyrin repeat protein